MKPPYHNSLKFFSRRSRRGSSLIILLMTLLVMAGLTSVMFMILVNHNNEVKRFQNSTAAFWAAETGISQYIANMNVAGWNSATWSYTVNNGNAILHLISTTPWARTIAAKGLVKGVARYVQIDFPYNTPRQFNNTMSIGGNVVGLDMVALGLKSGADGGSNLMSNGINEVSGTFQPLAGSLCTTCPWNYSDLDVNDILNPADTTGLRPDENVSTNNTKLVYPDMNGNNTPDEFADFVGFNRKMMDERYKLNTVSPVPYPPTGTQLGTMRVNGDAVHIKLFAGNGTVNIFRDPFYLNKKVVFVETVDSNGNAVADYGNITVFESPTPTVSSGAPNQNITLISTGVVTFSPNQNTSPQAEKKQMNVIGWGRNMTVGSTNYRVGYREIGNYTNNYTNPANAFTTRGVIYSHGDVQIFDLHSGGWNHRYHKGMVIANGHYLQGDWAMRRTFIYDNTTLLDDPNTAQVEHDAPPGFEGMVSNADPRYQNIPKNWQEVKQTF